MSSPPTTVAGALDYADSVRLLRSEHPQLADEIDSFAGVKDVLDWMQQHGRLERDGLDMVGQDEFEYDFLIRLEPDGRWLVFGVT